jgi:hypothetical protein
MEITILEKKKKRKKKQVFDEQGREIINGHIVHKIKRD